MEKIFNNKISIWIKNNFLLFFTIYFLAMFIETTTISNNLQNITIFTSLIKYITYIMFTFRFLMIIPDYFEQFKKLKCNHFKYYLLVIISIFLIMLSLVFTLVYTGSRKYIMILLILISSYGVDFLKISKRLEILQIFCTSIIAIGAIMGQIENYTIYRENGMIRNSLGFGYVTNLSQMIMFAMILHLFNNKFWIKKMELLYFQMLNILVFFITDSKTEFLLIESVLFITWLYNTEALIKYCIILGKKIMKIFCRTFWIIPIVTLLLVATYPSNPLSAWLDKVLSNRIRYPYSVMNEYGVSMFGEKIEFVGNGIKDKKEHPNTPSNYVDNEYLQCFFTNGIVFFIFEILLLNIYFYVIYKNKYYKKGFISMIFMLFALLNPRLTELIYCPILFLVINNIIDGPKD